MTIVAFHVEAQQEVGRGLGLDTEMGMNHALGLASRTRGVGDKQGRIGVYRMGGTPRVSFADGLLPVEIADWIGHYAAEPPQAEHGMDKWHLLQGFGQRRLHPDGFSPPGRRICRQHRNGTGIVQTGGDGVRGKTGEQRHRHGAQPCDAQKRRLDFRNHRHVDTYRLSGLHPASGKGRCDAGGLGGKLGIGPAAAASILANPVDRGLVAKFSRDAGVETGLCQIQGTPDSPSDRIWPRGYIPQLRIGTIEPDAGIADYPAPEPFRFGVGTFDETFVTARTTIINERRERACSLNNRVRLEHSLPRMKQKKGRT